MADAKRVPPKHPLAEVFGFPTDNHAPEAQRHRRAKLCPYHNKVPNCTKDKALDPLGVCSIYDDTGEATITCPIRFREDWIIAEDAAAFFFPAGAAWTSLTEIRLKDGNGQSAGNIDVVLVAYDERGQWQKKQAVALHKSFYATLPELPEVAPQEADIAWFLYSLEVHPETNRFHLTRDRVVYTAFESTMLKITTAPAGPIEDFIAHLQSKLHGHLNPPDAPTLQDILKGSDQKLVHLRMMGVFHGHFRHGESSAFRQFPHGLSIIIGHHKIPGR